MTSDAMAPTISRGELVRVTWNDRVEELRLKRWDIVVFVSPEAPDHLWMMRIIGLPGEKVEFREGNVLINDTPLSMPKDLGWAKYFVRSEMVSKVVFPTNLARNQYFVLGDNMAAYDSRYWGPLGAERIKGKLLDKLDK